MKIWPLAFSLTFLGFSIAQSETTEDSVLNLVMDEDALTILAEGKPVLTYHMTSPALPAGVDEVYAGSGFIHPVYTPDGQAVTQNYGSTHPHQRGLFLAWTKTTHDDEVVDFWNVHKGQGRVVHSKLIRIEEGPEQVTFVVERIHEKLIGEEAEPIISETWQVTVYPESNDCFIFDIVSVQTLLSEEPLTLNEYHYGGMALRLTDSWFKPSEEQDDELVEFLTSENKGRIAANHTRPKWVMASGPLGGEVSSIAVLGHPSNYRFPQPVRVHPDIPYFSFTPTVLGSFELRPGDEYASRYRYIVASKALSAQWLESQWEMLRDQRPLAAQALTPRRDSQ